MNGMLQKLLMVAAALALPASQAGASEAMWDDITKRSDCAQLELAEAMGDKVPADQVAACKSRPHKPPPPRHR